MRVIPRTGLWPHVACWALMGAAMPLGVWADVVTNDRGRQFEGQILRENNAGVTMLVTDGLEVTIPRNRIREVQRAELWENHLMLGDAHSERGSYQRATEHYEQALQADLPDDVMEEIRLRIAAAQAAMDSQIGLERGREVQTIADLIERADEQMTEGDLERAILSLNDAAALRPTAAQVEEISVLRGDVLYAQAYSLYDRRDQVGALGVLEDLLDHDRTHPQALSLYNRIIESQPVDSPEVVAEIRQILEANPDRLDLHVRLGDYLMRRHEYEEALPHLLAAAEDNLYLAQVRSQLRAAMIEAVNRAAMAADYDTAIERYVDLLRRFPQEDENYLNVLIYQRENRRLSEDDLDGRMALATQCMENGYEAWAREQMDRVLRQDLNHPVARQMHYRFAERDLREALSYLTEENFALARVQLRAFIQRYDYPDLIEEAQIELSNAERLMAELERTRREQAQTLVAQGDQYYEISRRHVEQWRRREYEERTSFVAIRGMNDRDEAVRYLSRAILAYETGLNLDPTLGPLEGGGVNLKLNDARQDLNRLTRGSLPRREPQFSRR